MLDKTIVDAFVAVGVGLAVVTKDGDVELCGVTDGDAVVVGSIDGDITGVVTGLPAQPVSAAASPKASTIVRTSPRLPMAPCSQRDAPDSRSLRPTSRRGWLEADCPNVLYCRRMCEGGLSVRFP